MIVHVTQEDIDNATPRDPHTCPVALAMNRAYNRDVAWVGPWILGFHNYHNTPLSFSQSLYWNTPPEVQTFINTYDRGTAVEPFDFELSDLVVSEERLNSESGAGRANQADG
jgi:hypothetical protein